MPQSTLPDDREIDAIPQTLEALTDEELDSQMSLRISFKEGCRPEFRRWYALTQALGREIQESRRQSMPGESETAPTSNIGRPNCVEFRVVNGVRLRCWGKT